MTGKMDFTIFRDQLNESGISSIHRASAFDNAVTSLVESRAAVLAQDKVMAAAAAEAVAERLTVELNAFKRACANYMGELCAAAKKDLDAANPADVGMNGVSIAGWRQAYLEGVKDMTEGIVTRVPENNKDEIRKAVRAAFDEEMAKSEPPGQEG